MKIHKIIFSPTGGTQRVSEILCQDMGKESVVTDLCGKIQRIEYKGAVHLFITVRGQKTAFDRAVKDAMGVIGNK